MVNNFQLPPMGFGPGSQVEEGEDLEYMDMPQDMRTYSLHVPEMDEMGDVSAALEMMEQISRACAVAAETGIGETFDLSGLNAENRALMAETMGAGEVAMKVRGIPAVAVQESVFAGVWGLKAAGVDKIEVGRVPDLAQSRAHEPFRPALLNDAPRTVGVVNAPSLLVELIDKSKTYTLGDVPHVVNLTLLPHTEEDLAWLAQALGQGATEVLSRGYGNCRVTATALPYVWRVQFYNSMDTLILDTFEVTDMPEVALAAKEDLEDSAERVKEVLEAIR
ncbi:hydrogenase expression/formation protein [Celeribacter litoreus]|uniref:hydrogenase expression/formation protein n=1 Tax=Celeribacter litoreus TaxID=2876714 RepID=UPI001CCFC530|nr:hydrogenase expression/formation protein [Celeribacter litoreus]MCA0043216.1 hydrogenase expression/formation protein [Celeribacter litoreus]